ncbi:hypothetical protein Tco_0382825 [Tanacetum coccineum]
MEAAHNNRPTRGMPEMSLLLYPAISQMMRTLLSSPQLMKQIIGQNPQLRNRDTNLYYNTMNSPSRGKGLGKGPFLSHMKVPPNVYVGFIKIRTRGAKVELGCLYKESVTVRATALDLVVDSQRPFDIGLFGSRFGDLWFVIN